MYHGPISVQVQTRKSFIINFSGTWSRAAPAAVEDPILYAYWKNDDRGTYSRFKSMGSLGVKETNGWILWKKQDLSSRTSENYFGFSHACRHVDIGSSIQTVSRSVCVGELTVLLQDPVLKDIVRMSLVPFILSSNAYVSRQCYTLWL